jgi:hypothetical protein
VVVDGELILTAQHVDMLVNQVDQVAVVEQQDLVYVMPLLLAVVMVRPDRAILDMPAELDLVVE